MSNLTYGEWHRPVEAIEPGSNLGHSNLNVKFIKHN